MHVLVTGGGGFLGGAVVQRLLARGDRVRSFARGDYPQLSRDGVDVCRGDLSDTQAVSRAVEGVDAVIHTAAKAGVWGPRIAFHRANVVGTENVLAACRRHGVTRLVFTSSPSVVFDAADQHGVDESVPYPRHYLAAYPETKATAERAVLAANGPELATTALRPHLIWGPGDPHLVARILARGRAGRLRRLGRAPRPVDSVYIDNAADAHLLALDRLAPGAPPAGRAYFIAQDEPIDLWQLVDRILAAGGVAPVRRTLSPRAAYVLGAGLELVYRLLRIRAEPLLTRFVVRQLTTAHWFDLSAARRDLGYAPRVSLDEGLRRLAAALRHEAAG